MEMEEKEKIRRIADEAVRGMDGRDGNTHIEDVLDGIQDVLEEYRREEIKCGNVGMGPEEGPVEESPGKESTRRIHEKTCFLLLVVLPLFQIFTQIFFPMFWSVAVFLMTIPAVFILGCILRHHYMMVTEFCIFICGVFILCNGYKDGMQKDDMYRYTAREIWKMFYGSPECTEYENMEDLDGKFVYAYRFTCRDCHDVYSDLEAVVSSYGYEFVPVEIRSPLGLKVMDEFHLREVPSGIAINGDDRAARILYGKNEGSETYVRYDALADLFSVLDGKQGGR